MGHLCLRTPYARLLTGLLVVLCNCVAAQTPQTPVIGPQQAVEHVGEFCIVEGRIVEVSWRQRATFLNYRPYRRGSRDFYLVIVGSDREKFDRREVERWEGKMLRVYGRIELYRGRPQIRLRDPSQVKVVEERRPRPRPRPPGAPAAELSIAFLGAAREVGGSAILLSTGRSRVLLDCGAFYGERRKAQRADKFRFDPATLDAVVISHVHLDHIGRLPWLVLGGYEGKVFSTRITRELAPVMLQQVIKFDAGLEGRISARRLVERFVAEDYGVRFPITPDMDVTFLDAGHIPGSAVIVLDVRLQRGRLRIAYTGDYGNGLSPFLRSPAPVPAADVLIVEATYGGRRRRIQGEPFGPFVDALAKAVAQRRRVVIPSFVLDRTQKLMWVIGRAIRAGRLPENVPVFVTSPTARQITKLYRTFWAQRDLFGRYFRPAWLRQEAPFFGLRALKAEAGRRVGPPPRPSITIASSADGQYAASRTLIEALAEDEETAFFIVGYAPPETPVGQLARMARGGPRRELRLGARRLRVRAAVRRFAVFSAHADQEQMVRFVTGCKNWRHVFVVHGDEEACEALVERLRAVSPARQERIVAPRLGQAFRIAPRRSVQPAVSLSGQRALHGLPNRARRHDEHQRLMVQPAAPF